RLEGDPSARSTDRSSVNYLEIARFRALGDGSPVHNLARATRKDATVLAGGRLGGMSRTSIASALVLITFVASACTHHVVTSNAVTATHACVKTECTQFIESQQDNCSSCSRRCASLNGCDPSSVCSEVCDIIACSGNMATKCAESVWTWSVPEAATPGVAEACERADETISTICPVETADEDGARRTATCAKAARVNSPAVIAVYDCYAKMTMCTPEQAIDCDADSSFGTEICGAVQKCPGACSDDDWYRLDDAIVMKPEILDAARECTRQASCGDIRGCLEAWRAAFE
ncbi:MAG: hypothetical protein JWP87_254, partial [Labilithrix sp.]|nr:hypothetical protein [Labilithrix sp.]